MTARGLIDTGASCTCVDRQIIRSLNLSATGLITIHTPSTGATPQTCQQYDISLMFLQPQVHIAELTIPVVEVDIAHQGYEVLIGRDVLARCLLVYDGKHGTVTVAF